jgi:hypothetical protein
MWICSLVQVGGYVSWVLHSPHRFDYWARWNHEIILGGMHVTATSMAIMYTA